VTNCITLFHILMCSYEQPSLTINHCVTLVDVPSAVVEAEVVSACKTKKMHKNTA